MESLEQTIEKLTLLNQSLDSTPDEQKIKEIRNYLNQVGDTYLLSTFYKNDFFQLWSFWIRELDFESQGNLNHEDLRYLSGSLNHSDPDYDSDCDSDSDQVHQSFLSFLLDCNKPPFDSKKKEKKIKYLNILLDKLDTLKTEEKKELLKSILHHIFNQKASQQSMINPRSSTYSEFLFKNSDPQIIQRFNELVQFCYGSHQEHKSRPQNYLDFVSQSPLLKARSYDFKFFIDLVRDIDDQGSLMLLESYGSEFCSDLINYLARTKDAQLFKQLLAQYRSIFQTPQNSLFKELYFSATLADNAEIFKILQEETSEGCDIHNEIFEFDDVDTKINSLIQYALYIGLDTSIEELFKLNNIRSSLLGSEEFLSSLYEGGMSYSIEKLLENLNLCDETDRNFLINSLKIQRNFAVLKEDSQEINTDDGSSIEMNTQSSLLSNCTDDTDFFNALLDKIKELKKSKDTQGLQAYKELRNLFFDSEQSFIENLFKNQDDTQIEKFLEIFTTDDFIEYFKLSEKIDIPKFLINLSNIYQWIWAKNNPNETPDHTLYNDLLTKLNTLIHEQYESLHNAHIKMPSLIIHSLNSINMEFSSQLCQVYISKCLQKLSTCQAEDRLTTFNEFFESYLHYIETLNEWDDADFLLTTLLNMNVFEDIQEDRSYLFKTLFEKITNTMSEKTHLQFLEQLLYFSVENEDEISQLKDYSNKFSPCADTIALITFKLFEKKDLNNSIKLFNCIFNIVNNKTQIPTRQSKDDWKSEFIDKTITFSVTQDSYELIQNLLARSELSHSSRRDIALQTLACVCTSEMSKLHYLSMFEYNISQDNTALDNIKRLFTSDNKDERVKILEFIQSLVSKKIQQTPTQGLESEFLLLFFKLGNFFPCKVLETLNCQSLDFSDEERRNKYLDKLKNYYCAQQKIFTCPINCEELKFEPSALTTDKRAESKIAWIEGDSTRTPFSLKTLLSLLLTPVKESSSRQVFKNPFCPDHLFSIDDIRPVSTDVCHEYLHPKEKSQQETQQTKLTFLKDSTIEDSSIKRNHEPKKTRKRKRSNGE